MPSVRAQLCMVERCNLDLFFQREHFSLLTGLARSFYKCSRAVVEEGSPRGCLDSASTRWKVWLHLGDSVSMAFQPSLPWHFSSRRSLESESLPNYCVIYCTTTPTIFSVRSKQRCYVLLCILAWTRIYQICSVCKEKPIWKHFDSHYVTMDSHFFLSWCLRIHFLCWQWHLPTPKISCLWHLFFIGSKLEQTSVSIPRFRIMFIHYTHQRSRRHVQAVVRLSFFL